MFKNFFKDINKKSISNLDIDSLSNAKKETSLKLEEHSQKSLDFYNKAIIKINIFSALGREEDLKEASLLLEESLKYKKTSDSYFWLAFIFYMFGKVDLCNTFLNASEELDPTNQKILEFKKQFRL
jgi:hypothetical protein